MAITRNPRAGIDDRWHRRVKGPDGVIRKERSAVYGQVARWRVRWVDDTGREHSKVFRLKDAAQSHLDKVTADVVRGEYVSPGRSTATFGAVAAQWLDGKAAKKPKTVAGYRSLLDHLVLPRWHDTKLKDITHGDIQRWISGLSANGSVRTEGKGLSASRVIQAHQCMSAVLKYAIRTDRLAKNVANAIELPRKTASEHRYLTHGQLQELAEYIGPFDSETEHLGLLTLVMGYCGLRFGEAIALRAKDVQNRTIAVRASVTSVTGSGYVEGTPKTHRTRSVPVPAFLWEGLEEQAWRENPDPTSGWPRKMLDAEPDQLVFPGREGGYLTNFEYRKVFDPAAKDIGVPGLVPHELRHTCASLAIAAGANVLAVQRLLGHETATMTLDTYGHLFSDDLTKVANSLDEGAKAARAAAG
jgi:integrase